LYVSCTVALYSHFINPSAGLDEEENMGALHPMHLVLVLVVVLLVFGPKKLPELARGVGDAMKELQRSLHGAQEVEDPGLAIAKADTNPAAMTSGAGVDGSAAAGTPPHLAA
jgi:sec-independent protein translocase protein TatA